MNVISRLNHIHTEYIDVYPYWINMFYLLIGSPNCLIVPYDMMAHTLYPHRVKYDYTIIMEEYTFIKSDPVEDHSWKYCTLRNREYEAFLPYPILDEVKCLIYSYL